MSRLYLDASCIIYLVEASSPFHATVVARVARHGADPESRIVTSRLSLLECRTRPLKEADSRLLAAYDEFFGARRFTLADASDRVIERATELRARHGFRTPDAIHLATAIEERADLVLTGDVALRRCSEVAVEVVEP